MSDARSTQSPKTREATLDDSDGVHALAAQLAEIVGDDEPDAEQVRTRLEELLEEPRARVIVAERETGIVGVATLWIKPDLAHGDTVVEVPMLAVAEDARHSGVGRQLILSIRDIAVEHNAGLIELVATRDNVAAQDFYRSLGFVEADVIPLEFVGDIHNPPDK